jgi:hypothetical protein
MKRLAFAIYWLVMVLAMGWQLALVFYVGWRLVRWALRRRTRRTYASPPPASIELPAGYDRKRDPIDRRTRQLVLARDGHRCKNPRCRTKRGPFQVDHIWPVSRGGTDRLVNLQTLCAPCNRAKSATVPHWTLVPQGEPIHYTDAELAAMEALSK